ncbi:MAG: 2-hydroxyacyl-CoA dehydratase [Elusimicrobia bacterium]|nr:2-hydroxyacyl-CoA dehydratase [Elusimicrobiota bacterium]
MNPRAKLAAPPPKQSHYQGRMHALQKDLIGRWYQDLHGLWERQQGNSRSDDGRWTGAVPIMVSGNCVELLRAFDLLPIYPEINALQLAIKKQALEFLLKAEERGYSTDSCGYVKADVAFYAEGAETPLKTRLPKPALVLCNFVGCNTYIKWFEHLAHMTGAPLFMLDVPFLRRDRPSREDVAYVVRQLEELIVVLERVSGRSFDIDRLREILALSAKTEQRWSDIKALTKRRPSPFDAYFDSTTMMGPLYVSRGTEEGLNFFEETFKEFEEKAGLGVGVVPEERFRIVAEGPPPYPFFKAFRDLFTTWGACNVASTYSCVGGTWEFGFRHDPADPLESIALHMIEHNVTNRNYNQRYEQIERYVREWEADARVIHSVNSCRLFSAGQGDMRERFSKELGIPTLFVESDLEDPRYYSAAQMRNRFDAFFESLAHKKSIEASPAAMRNRP